MTFHLKCILVSRVFEKKGEGGGGVLSWQEYGRGGPVLAEGDRTQGPEAGLEHGAKTNVDYLGTAPVWCG